jgi:cell division protein ZapA
MTNKGAGATARSVQLDIRILGREFKVACKEEERAELLEAVSYVDAKMREIRDSGKIAGVERVAIMAALNIANDLLRERQSPAATPPASSSGATIVDEGMARRRIQSMQAAIDQALAGQEKLF